MSNTLNDILVNINQGFEYLKRKSRDFHAIWFIFTAFMKNLRATSQRVIDWCNIPQTI